MFALVCQPATTSSFLCFSSHDSIRPIAAIGGIDAAPAAKRPRLGTVRDCVVYNASGVGGWPSGCKFVKSKKLEIISLTSYNCIRIYNFIYFHLLFLLLSWLHLASRTPKPPWWSKSRCSTQQIKVLNTWNPCIGIPCFKIWYLWMDTMLTWPLATQWASARCTRTTRIHLGLESFLLYIPCTSGVAFGTMVPSCAWA